MLIRQLCKTRLNLFCSVLIYLGLFSYPVYPQTLAQVDKIISAGRYSSALDSIHSFIEKDSSNTQAYYKAGLIYQNLMQYGRGTQYLEKAAALAPDKLDIQYALGKNYYQIDRYADARIRLRKVFRADPSHIAAGTYLGIILMKLREYKAADEVHLTLLAEDATNANAYKQLGISAFHQGDDSTSISNTGKYFSKFEKWSQDTDPDVLYYTGKNYMRAGEVRAAMFAFKEGAKQFPHFKVFHRELAGILYGQQQYEEAIAPFSQLIALGDSTAGIYQRLGFCYYYMDNMVKAKEAFGKSFNKDPSNGLTAFYLGITQRVTGNLEHAIAIFERAEELSYPVYLGQLYTQMATAYQEAGEYEKSVSTYKQAKEYSNNVRNILFHIATIYDGDLAETEKALKYYQRYLQHPGATKPDNQKYAEQRVQKLKERQFFSN